MKTEVNEKGFRSTVAEPYVEGSDERLFSESTMIGEYDHSLAEPGSSYLWFGVTHHFDREEVAELITHMQTWLDTYRLPEPEEEVKLKLV